MKTIRIKETKSKQSNINRYGDHEDSCIRCGKRTNMTHWVHMTTNWEATTAKCEDIGDLSQGWFPIGPNCAKTIPSEFIDQPVLGK